MLRQTHNPTSSRGRRANPITGSEWHPFKTLRSPGDEQKVLHLKARTVPSVHQSNQNTGTPFTQVLVGKSEHERPPVGFVLVTYPFGRKMWGNGEGILLFSLRTNQKLTFSSPGLCTSKVVAELVSEDQPRVVESHQLVHSWWVFRTWADATKKVASCFSPLEANQESVPQKKGK